MKRLIIKIISSFLILLTTLLSTALVVSGYDAYDFNLYSGLDNVTLLNNSKQVYLVGSSEKTVYIDSLYNNKTCTTLSLVNDVASINLCNNTFVMLCHKKSSKQTEVALYNISSDTLKSFVIEQDIQHLNAHTAFADNRVFIADNNGVVLQYSTKGKFINRYDLGSDICSLTCDFSDNVYALTENGVFLITQSACTRISNTEFLSAGRFISDSTFTSNFGSMYDVNSGSVEKILDFYNGTQQSGGGIYKNLAITFDDGVIYAFSTNDGKKLKTLNTIKNITELYVVDSTIIALAYANGTYTVLDIPVSQLKDINNGNNNSESDDKTKPDTGISSEVYTVDFDNMKILGVSSPTTVAKFKENMSYEGYKVRFYRYNKKEELKSGNVGTATLAVFYNEDTCFEFEICVIGDITGEGNVNTRDKSAMFDYLLDNIYFYGVFTDAADLNSTGDKGIEDLILLLRLIEKQK